MKKKDGMTPARERWSKLVREWRRRGETRDTFAGRAGVNPATLSFWAWRLGRDAREEAAIKGERCAVPTVRPGEFVELRIDRHDETSFVLALGDGRRLTIPPGFDSLVLRRLLATLDEGGR